MSVVVRPAQVVISPSTATQTNGPGLETGGSCVLQTRLSSTRIEGSSRTTMPSSISSTPIHAVDCFLAGAGDLACFGFGFFCSGGGGAIPAFEKASLRSRAKLPRASQHRRKVCPTALQPLATAVLHLKNPNREPRHQLRVMKIRARIKSSLPELRRRVPKWFLLPLHISPPGASQPTSRAGHRRLRAEPRRDWARR